MLETNFVKLCNISDIPENEMKIFNIHNIEFVVVKNNKEFHAVYNKCPHMGGSLENGSFDDPGYLTCPLHNWQFDLETGKGTEGYDDLITTDIDISTGTVVDHA